MTDLSQAVEACPLSAFVNTVSGKWAIPILYRLISTDGPVRFRELQRKAVPITQKELTKQLRLLEARGLVTRKVFPVVPLHVEYEATPIARELIDSLDGIAQWMRRNAPSLESFARSSEVGDTATKSTDAAPDHRAEVASAS